MLLALSPAATTTSPSFWWPHKSTQPSNMTFWSDLISVLTQLLPFSSSTVPALVPTTPLAENGITTFATTPIGVDLTEPSFQPSFDTVWDYNTSELPVVTENVTNAIKMMNYTLNESQIASNASDSVFTGLVDCSDFSEAKLMNLWNCTLLQNEAVNESVHVNSASSDYFYLETNQLNISDEILKLYYFNVTNDTELANNGTGNRTNVDSTIYFIQVLSTAIILGIIILATVIGNVFVIAAIILERNLQSVANYLILSLAVADLLVACLVMPLSAVYEISKEWKLGPELCDMWTSSDVLCCTASILHLVAIALDRYWAVTDIDYAHQRTAKRIGIMILILWVLSFLVSVAPMFGWKDPEWHLRLENYQCLVSQDISYQIFATASSFYVPLLVILFLYWRIFLTARKRIRRRQQGKTIVQLLPKLGVTYGQSTNPGNCVATSGGLAAAVVAVIGRPLPTISECPTTTTTTTQFTNVSSANTSPEKVSYANGIEDPIELDPPTADISVAYPSTQSCPPQYTPSKKTKKMTAHKVKPSILKKRSPNGQNDTNSKRERKAAKTLAIITGAFVCCWLPFFIIAIMLPLCPSCDISPIVISLCLWLGYFNSTLNPIIYTVFSPEFRNAFKRLLCGRPNSLRRRNRRFNWRNSR